MFGLLITMALQSCQTAIQLVLINQDIPKQVVEVITYHMVLIQLIQGTTQTLLVMVVVIIHHLQCQIHTDRLLEEGGVIESLIYVAECLKCIIVGLTPLLHLIIMMALLTMQHLFILTTTLLQVDHSGLVGMVLQLGNISFIHIDTFLLRRVQ